MSSEVPIVARCQFKGCRETATLCIVFGGKIYYICNKHHASIISKLKGICEKKGEASLDDLELKVRGKVITQVRIKKGKKRKKRKDWFSEVFG